MIKQLFDVFKILNAESIIKKNLNISNISICDGKINTSIYLLYKKFNINLKTKV